MGYNTAAIILNDGLSDIRKDPDAGKKIAEGITMTYRERRDIEMGNHANPITVLPSEHADMDQIVIIGQNYIRPVLKTFGMPHRVSQEELQEAVMRELANRLGYTLRKMR